jgi:hypothetical protein
MPTDAWDFGKREYKCEGCSFASSNRKEVKKHIYAMRKDRNKSDKRNHR